MSTQTTWPHGIKSDVPTIPHRPLTDRDMALITVLCQDRETRCAERAQAARANGNLDAEKIALADLWRYRSLRFKMFSAA